MSEVRLYTAQGCHLCDEAKRLLDDLAPRLGFSYEIVVIDGDPALESAYRAEIPVVELGGRKHAKYRLDSAKFERALRAFRGDPR